MKEKNIGICHICLEEKKLTFEHIPPESCFNSSKVSIGTKTSQRGIGGYTLCGDCNSKTGSWYVNDFNKLAYAAHFFLSSNTDNSIKGYGIKLENFNPLYCAKQILTILLSILPVDLIKKIQITDVLLNKSAHLNNCDFQIFIGSSLDQHKSCLFVGPILINGIDQCFCLDSYPFKLLFIYGKGYSHIPGFSELTDLLRSEDIGNIKYTFNIGYSKNDLFDTIKSVTQFR